MTTTPVSHVDFSTLTSELGILPIAPSWAEVQRALERIQTNRASEELTVEDFRTIMDFYWNLEEHRETLALALYCAAILGTAAPSGSAGERLEAGLRAISHCHMFSRLDKEGRLERLQSLAQTLQTRFELPRYDVPTAVTPEMWRRWWQKLPYLEVRAKAEKLWANVNVDAIWSNWYYYLMQDALVKGSSFFSPNLEDLVGAVMQEGPYQFFRPDLREMTLTEWSDAFFAATTGTIPSGFIAPTLLRLQGPLSIYKINNVEEIMNLAPSAQFHARELIRHIRKTARTRLTLLIRLSTGSLIEKCPPATIAGLIALSDSQLRDLGELLQPLEPRLIILELPVEGPLEDYVGKLVPEVIFPRLRFPRYPITHFAYLAPGDAKIEVADDAPVIYGPPKYADDLLLQAQELTGIDLTRKPPAKSGKSQEGDEE